MGRTKRQPWTPERRLKVAKTWEKRQLEEANEEIADSTAKEVRSRVCVYCGEKWDKEKHAKEHVPLQSVRRLLPADHKVEYRLVKICLDCKRMLKYDKSTTVRERRAVLKEQLLWKYSTLLKWEDWPQDKIELLGARFREHIQFMSRAKHRLERRLAYKANE